MSAQGHIRLEREREGRVAVLVISNPRKRNAITRTMWRELREQVERLQAEPALAAIVLRGAGDHFAAGADIEEFPQFRHDEALLRAYHEGLVAPALRALLDSDVPLVAQIAGNCVGGGLEIAACCDLRIASDDAVFGVPIAKLGFPMAPDELAPLLALAGHATVGELLLEARLLDASSAQQRGLVQHIVSREALDAELGHTLDRLCALPPEVARRNKRTLRQLERGGLSAQERSAHFDYADTPAHREGIAAFIAGRQPRFEP
jgi:enoyl-CoA hydratase/carnithine racemase